MSSTTPHARDLPPLLLVEDNPDHALLSREALEEAGLRNPVYVIETCQESITYLQEAAGRHEREGIGLPCLILLDIWLPDASGFDVLQAVRTHQALQRIPVIVLSTAQDQPTLNFAHRLGAVHYLIKPLDLDELRIVTSRLGLVWEPAAEGLDVP
jgi:two-component system response regulator